MSTSNRPVLFGVSTNEAGWQAAIHAVRPLHRLPCALRAACWPIGPRSVAARAATAAAHRAHQPPDGDGRRPPPARRWCTASAGTLASRPSTRTPARPRQASPAQASLRSCGLAQRQPAQWPPRRAGGRSSGLLEFLVDSPARPPAAARGCPCAERGARLDPRHHLPSDRPPVPPAGEELHAPRRRGRQRRRPLWPRRVPPARR